MAYSSNVKNYTDDQILSRVESLPSFEGWRVGKYSIYVRSNEDEYNKFDDKVYLYEVTQEGVRPTFYKSYPCTTNAGSVGLKSFEKYNKNGCAVALADYIGYNTHVFGKHGKTQYYAYVQTFKGKQYPYMRDNDKDNQAENFGQIYWDRIGMNIHKAGVDTEDINGNSIGCLVYKRLRDFDTFMLWAKREPMNVSVLNEF